VVSARRAP